MGYTISSMDSFKLSHNLHFAEEATGIAGKGDMVVIDTAEIGTTVELLKRGVVATDIRFINRCKKQVIVAQKAVSGLKGHAVTFNQFAKSSYRNDIRAAYVDSCSSFSNLEDGLKALFTKKLFVHKAVLFLTCTFRQDCTSVDAKLYRAWKKDGIVEFATDTPVVKKANCLLTEMAWQAGYRLSRYTPVKVPDAHYRHGVYLLRYVILKL